MNTLFDELETTMPNGWQRIKLSRLLTSREERYKPNSPIINNLKRIEKIDFDGNIVLSNKPSNTDMILIKKGDLVISGINVTKGALAVYDGAEDIVATIHYSAYFFNKKGLDIDFFKFFLKSTLFISLLREKNKGGIKTEIKSKQLLSLEPIIPYFELQQQIAAQINQNKGKQDYLLQQLEQQLQIIQQLRQAFLREAMQGKLVEQSATDEPATELLARIATAKANSSTKRKAASLFDAPPRTLVEDAPFDIPANWVWCRLGEICNYGTTIKCLPAQLDDNTWVLDLEDIEKMSSKLLVKMRFKDRNALSTKNFFKKGDVLYSKLRPYLDKVIIADEDGVCTTEILPLTFHGNILAVFMKYALKAPHFISYANSVTKGMKMPRLGTKEGQCALIPLPPLAEQTRIVEKLDELMSVCDALQRNVENGLMQLRALQQVALSEALQMPSE